MAPGLLKCSIKVSVSIERLCERVKPTCNDTMIILHEEGINFYRSIQNFF